MANRGHVGNDRSGVSAAALGAVLPGLGHGYLGRWWRAAAWALPVLGLAALGVAAARMGSLDLLGLAVTPAFLRTLLFANLFVAIWRIAAVADPYRLSEGSRSAWTLATVVLIGFLVAAPHVVIARYTVDAAYALDQVFVSGDPEPVVPLASPSSLGEVISFPDPAGVPRPKVSNPSRRSVIPEGTDLDGNAPMRRYFSGPPPEDPSDLIGIEYGSGSSRVTILLVGGDGGPGRSGNRTDSIMVATFDTVSGKSVVFGIPRNMTHMPLPEEWSTAFLDLEKRMTPWDLRKHWTDDDGDGEPDQFEPCHCFPDQINAIYPYTRAWTVTYPDERDPGLAALRDTLEIMLGMEIDYYAMVDMSGFVRLVDALGGVRAYVTGHVVTEVSPAREGEDWISVDLSPGWNRLDGHEALAYVRERSSVSDYTRMMRQRCLLKAVVAQADPLTLATRFSGISKAVGSSVKTDIPLVLLPTLIRNSASLDFDDVATVGFVPPYYTPTLDHRGNPTPDLPRIHSMVQWALNLEADSEFASGSESECRI